MPLERDDDLFDEVKEAAPERTREDNDEMEVANEEYQKLFKEIKDTLSYQNLHFMVPLKSRVASEVEAAIRFLYIQLRSEGLPVQRVHSDRARELHGQGIRKWLLERDIYPTTGEAQTPQSNGRAEQVVKALKRRARTLLQSSGLPRSCWPLAMGHAAWAQREHALGRAQGVVPFGAPVSIKARVFGQGGKFDLNNRWDNGVFVGPATELKGGYVVRDTNGRYLTTMHMKTNVVDVDELISPEPAEAELPMPMRRVKGKVKLATVEEGEVHPPTRDSEPGSPSLGPSGAVVVPDHPTRGGGGGERESLVSAPGPSRRLHETTSLRTMTSLTMLEQQVEELAEQYDVDERYDEQAVLQLYSLLERTQLQGSRAVNRRSQTTSTSWSAGMFTHGGVSGLRRTTRRMPATTAFLVKAAKELTGEKCFGVVAVTKGAQLRAHRDSHNDASTNNTVLALTDFQGGGLWVEGPPGDQWRQVASGRWVQGKTYELQPGVPLTFSPKRWHETQPFQGDRIVMMIYTPRVGNLSEEDR